MGSGPESDVERFVVPYALDGAVVLRDTRRAVRRLRVATVVIAVVACSTCLRIEILNARAGGVLPNREPGEWRAVSGGMAARSWRTSEALGRSDPSLATRPLTPAEDRELQSAVRKAQASSDLRDVVGRWGLLQYLLVPGGLLVSLALVWKGRTRVDWRVAACCSIVLLTCGGSMLGRAYFTSLGW